MTYAAFETRVLPIFIYYIILSILGILITLQMFKKWKERNDTTPLYLTCVFGLLTIAIIVLAVGLAEAAITGYYKEIYRISLPLAYCLLIIAHIWLYLFATHVTNKGKKIFIPLVIIGIILIVVIFLPWNWWGVPHEDFEGQLNIRLYTNLGIVVFSYFIYITIMIITLKVKKQIVDKIARVGLTLLFYSMISMILFFVMVLMDNLMIVFFRHPGYSVFQYIAWIFAVLFIILTYLSLVMPKWLIKLIEKNESNE